MSTATTAAATTISGIPSLAPEILDLIASEITHPRDLVPFALVHSTFYETAVPHHINWRVVECAIDDGDVWDDLENHARRLQNIRTLKVHVVGRRRLADEGREIARNPPRGESEGEANLRILPLELLARMSQLRTFVWRNRTSRWGVGIYCTKRFARSLIGICRPRYLSEGDLK